MCDKRFSFLLFVVFFGTAQGLIRLDVERRSHSGSDSKISLNVEGNIYGANEAGDRSSRRNAQPGDSTLCVAVAIFIFGACCAAYVFLSKRGSDGDDDKDDNRGLRYACYQALFGGETADIGCGVQLGALVNLAIIGLIVLNVSFVLFESEANRNLPIYKVWYTRLEEFSLVFFSIEYCLRVWCCVEDEKYKEERFPRLSFMMSPFAVIDLLALFPFAFDLYLTDESDESMRAATLVRLLRVFSLLRLERNVRSFARVFKVLRNKGEELMVTLFTAVIMLIVSASLIFYLENGKQPDKFPSIVASMWWAVTALTTVGYGDIYPITTAGKVVACLVAFIGIGFFALPAGIIGSGFVETMIEEKQVASQSDAVRRAVKALRDDKPEVALKLLEEELNLIEEKSDHR